MKELRPLVKHSGPFRTETVCCACSYRIVVSGQTLEEWSADAASVPQEMAEHLKEHDPQQPEKDKVQP